jgi:hypothetical protein
MCSERTSSVIAIAKTPSLKATIRENYTSFRSRRVACVSSLIRRSSPPAATESRPPPP